MLPHQARRLLSLRPFDRIRTEVDCPVLWRREMSKLTCIIFEYRRSELVVERRTGEGFKCSEFDSILLHHWNNAMKKGCFRYTLDHVLTRTIPGNQQFIAQFNDKRTTSRRRPPPITHINQPFDANKFNFTKIQDDEILFKMDPVPEGIILGDVESDGSHVVIINDSPVDVGHVLLVPRIQQGLPQVLTEEALCLALDMMLLSEHRGFRLGWNSLGALASVNHLHFHGFYLNFPLIAENIDVVHLAGGCYEIVNQSTRGFGFQLHGQTQESLARLVFQVASHLTDREVAHNLFITRGKTFPSYHKPLSHSIANTHNTSADEPFTIRVFLWPKSPMFDFKDDPPFLNACIEPAGFLVIKDLESYQTLTEEGVNSLLSKYSMTESEFQTVKKQVCQLLE